MSKLTVRESELPVVLELVGKDGQRKHYQLLRARKVFGVCLNVIKDSIVRALPGRSRQG
jgi:hypothetical protein